MVKKIVNGKEIDESEDVIREVPCFACKNLLLYPKCMAYIDGIPDEIRQGLHDHSIPKGDEDTDADGKPIIFTPFDSKESMEDE
jgi:hypothetical protein